MKKLILIFGCVYLLNLNYCYSQEWENGKRVYYSKTRVVHGYSKDFNGLDIGITFKKVINLKDTAYYVKFQLYAPATDFRNDIQIKKSGSITFLSKSGKAIDLKLTNVVSSTDSDKQIVDPYSTVDAHFSTILIVEVTKEKLIDIGSEPFYHLILPYYNSSTEVENKAIFAWPTLLTKRIFIQRNVKYILEI
jgi:hypothetical protein